MKARVEIFLKPGVLDVQGKAIEAALHGLGFAGVRGVRVGKVITFDLEATDRAGAELEARRMSETLLANQVIETFHIEIAP